MDHEDGAYYSSGEGEDEDDEDEDERRNRRRVLSGSRSISMERPHSVSLNESGDESGDISRALHFSPIRNNDDDNSPKLNNSSHTHTLNKESVSSSSMQDTSPTGYKLQSDELLEQDEKKTPNFFSFLPGFSNKSKKKKKRNETKRKKSGDHLRDTHFHLDVNTALQSVEEHIISRVESPTKETTRKDNMLGFGALHAQDSFVQHVSEDPLQRASSSSSAQEHEKSFVLPAEFEMVSPLQQIAVPSQQYPSGPGLAGGGYMVGSPPTDHHSIPLIASGGMAALSLQSSFAGSPAPGLLMTSPRKQKRQPETSVTASYSASESMAQTITGRIRRLSLPTTFLKSESKMNAASLPPPEQHQNTVNSNSNSSSSRDGSSVESAGDLALSASSSNELERKEYGSALQHALDKEKVTHCSQHLEKLEGNTQSSTELLASQSTSSLSSSSIPLSLHIPEPPVPPEVLKNVVMPVDKRPVLTNEEFKQKKLIRKMVYELDLNWREEDFPVIKRLSWYLLKDIKHVHKEDSLWTGNEEAVAMGLLISGRLEAVTAPSSTSSPYGSRKNSNCRTLQVIMPGTLIGTPCLT